MRLPLSLSPDELLGQLPADTRALLARVTAVAAAQPARLWLVGGAVRDLLLGQSQGRDLDLAVEGDVAALAPALATALGGQLLASHVPFGTATLAIGGLLIDLAGTRVERYPRPASLPEVAPAPIAADLIRRDFSLNALALELRDSGGLRAGALLDPFGGRADLAAGQLRLLHPLSLRDDPTRILRGLRLAARLGLQLDPASAAQLADALAAGYLGLLSAERSGAEICLALEEPRPDLVLRAADAWGVTGQLAPGLAWTAALAERCARLASAEAGPPEPALKNRPDAGAHPGGSAELPAPRAAQQPAASPALGGAPERSLIWLGLLTYDLADDTRAALAARYRPPTPFAALLRAIGQLRGLAAPLAQPLAPSAIDRLLRPLSTAAVAVLHYAESGPASRAAGRYLHELRGLATPLDGHDLRRLGIPPGPQLGRLLDELRAARLDSVVTTRAEAERWLKARLQEPAGQHPPED